MRVVLKYGTEGIPLEIPETPGFAGILTPSEPEPLIDPGRAIVQSLQEPIRSRPLAQLARGKKSACIVVSDITRPVPNPLILTPLLETLRGAGIPCTGVSILIATGMHRPTTEQEVVHLVGKEIVQTYRVIDHSSRSHEDLVDVGRIGGQVPAHVNRHYASAELKILTGFIEPHMWSGYSGGRKSILPGISSLETLQYMHGPEMVAHPGCAYGVLAGNPFHEAGLEVMAMVGADFIVNITLNSKKEVSGVFSGHPIEAHLKGCAFLSRYCVMELEAPLDFIVTTNSGAPLDCNLYQTVKGITGAAPVVKSGGDILIASRCLEGAGSPEYKKVLEMVDSPRAFLNRIMQKELFIPDQWCAQEMYQVMAEQKVWLYAEGFTPEELIRYHFHPVSDVGQGIRDLLDHHGHDARWAVVPDGPMLVLKLQNGRR